MPNAKDLRSLETVRYQANDNPEALDNKERLGITANKARDSLEARNGKALRKRRLMHVPDQMRMPAVR